MGSRHGRRPNTLLWGRDPCPTNAPQTEGLYGVTAMHDLRHTQTTAALAASIDNNVTDADLLTGSAVSMLRSLRTPGNTVTWDSIDSVTGTPGDKPDTFTDGSVVLMRSRFCTMGAFVAVQTLRDLRADPFVPPNTFLGTPTAN